MQVPSTDLQGKVKRKSDQAHDHDPKQDETQEVRDLRCQRLEMLPAFKAQTVDYLKACAGHHQLGQKQECYKSFDPAYRATPR